MRKNNTQRARELSARTVLARIQRSRGIWEGFWRSLTTVGPATLKYGCIAWGCSKAASVLIAWSGSDTKADVKLNVVADVLSEPKAGFALPWVLSFVLWLLYRREKKRRAQAVALLNGATRR